MEVTKDNFAAAAAELEALLPTAEFIAIDEEMTGIILDKTTQPSFGDSAGARYRKMRRVANEFNLMQVGVSLFHRDTDGNLVARPYNFYVFPSGKSARSRLVMTADTAHFHNDNGMDFNKWIRSGVPFLSRVEFDAAEAAALEEPAFERRPVSQRLVLTRPDDKTFVADALGEIATWLAGGAGHPVDAEGTGASGGEAVDGRATEHPELVLAACNGFRRRALFEAMEEAYPDLTTESRSLPDDKYLKQVVVMRMTEADKEARRAEKRQQRLDRLQEQAGFLRVFNALRQANKPIVGHNLLYDLMFLLSHFSGPLPETMDGFKAAVRETFPGGIWDTKYCAVAAGCYPDTVRHDGTNLAAALRSCQPIYRLASCPSSRLLASLAAADARQAAPSDLARAECAPSNAGRGLQRVREWRALS